jgi:hypothetical protein
VNAGVTGHPTGASRIVTLAPAAILEQAGYAV